MQTEESPKFRLNIQVLAMLAVVMAALAVPVAGVVVSAQRALQGSRGAAQGAPSPEVPIEAAGGLQESLDHLAGQVLLPVETIIPVSVKTKDVVHEKERLTKLIEGLGGEAIVTREAPDEAVMMAKIPAEQAAVFRSAFKQAEFSVPQSGSVFFEIQIQP